MSEQTDSQLLRDYVEKRSEAAFAELARRHVDLVYSAALRMVCDPHLAEDVTQGAFVALAKSADRLTERRVLSGWLHRTAQNIAAQTVRTIERRRAREKEAAAMNELLANGTGANWDDIAPHLDAALGELPDGDRDVLMLRFFERKSAREIAELLGLGDEAAQKRVNRAVERLRERLAKRGITANASGLAVVIPANAVQVAPVGLVATLTSASVVSAAAGTGTLTFLNLVAMTKLQLGIVSTLVVAVGTLVVIRQDEAGEATPRDRMRASADVLSAPTNERPASPFARTSGMTQPAEPEPMYQGKTLSEWIADLRSGDSKLKQTAWDTLISIGPPAIPALEGALGDIRTVNSAAFILAMIGKEALPVLLNSLTNGPILARKEIAGAGVMQVNALLPYEDDIVPALLVCMRDDDATVRGGAVNAFQSYFKRPDLAVPPLLECLNDTNANVRGSAVTVIRQFRTGAAPAVSNLVWLARQDEDSHVRTRAAESLRVISPERAEQEGF